MHFLHQSWANLTEADEEQIRMQQEEFTKQLAQEAAIDAQIEKEVQANIDQLGFKLVTSRSSKKKSQKALTTKASTSYLTRSKVPGKHFK